MHTSQVSVSRTVSDREGVGNDGTILVSGRERVVNDVTILVSGHEPVGSDGTVLNSGQQRLGTSMDEFRLESGTGCRDGNGFRRDTAPFCDRPRHARRRTKQKIEQVVAPNGPRAFQTHFLSQPTAPVGALKRSIS